MNTNETILSSKITNALERSLSHVLLSDSHNSWAHEDIISRMTLLEEWFLDRMPAGSLVGIALNNSAPQALLILTLLRVGLVPVMFNPSEITEAHMARIAKSKVCLLVIPEGKDIKSSFPHLVISKTGHIVESPSNIKVTTMSLVNSDVALVLQTSGSTGEAKFIHVPKIGIAQTSDFLISYFTLDEKTKAPVMLSNHHSMALNTQFLPTFIAGGSCHFIDPMLELHRLYRSILHTQGNFVGLTSEMLLICSEEQSRRNLPLASDVQHVQLAGGLITDRHLNLANEIFPSATIHKGYGLTEGIRVTMINNNDPLFRSASVGFPLPFVEVEIRENKQLINTPETRGEIFVRGPNVQNNFISEDNFLPTGDIGFWNSQKQLCVVGRKDGIFKINGNKVSTYEIERMALESSHYIRNAACFAIEESRRKLQKLVLMLEVPPDHENSFYVEDFAQIQTQLFERFRSLSYFPKEIATLDRFPRTSTGKLAIKELVTIYKNSTKNPLAADSQSALQFYKILSA